MKTRFSLQRLPLLLLLLALLTAQWGWLAHEHQAHDSGQVCEVCVSGASLGHAVSGPSIHTFSQGAVVHHDTPLLHDTLLQAFYSPLLARAPPRLFV
jgi:hypothetical protein